MKYRYIFHFDANAPPISGSRNTATPSREKSKAHAATTATATIMYLITVVITLNFFQML